NSHNRQRSSQSRISHPTFANWLSFRRFREFYSNQVSGSPYSYQWALNHLLIVLTQWQNLPLLMGSSLWVSIAGRTESVLIISMASSQAMSYCCLAPTEISNCPSHSIKICSLLCAIPFWSRFVVC